MQEFLKKVPIWLLALATLGLFVLLVYSVYDDRSIKLGPLEIGASHVEPTITNPQPSPLAPDFDSDWFEIGTCQVKDMTDRLDKIGFSSLPALLTAYYKVTVNGKELIIPWGVSQYGDGTQLNGLIIDISVRRDGRNLGLFVRSPCKTKDGTTWYNPRLLHLGWYRDRIDHQTDAILRFDKVEFRVLLWKSATPSARSGE